MNHTSAYADYIQNLFYIKLVTLVQLASISIGKLSNLVHADCNTSYITRPNLICSDMHEIKIL